MGDDIPTNQKESNILGVSMRGWIAFELVTGVLVLAYWHPALIEALKYGFTAAIGFYFGQKNK